MESLQGSEETHATEHHRIDERVAHLERRLDALEETVRSLALELRQLVEAADSYEDLG